MPGGAPTVFAEFPAGLLQGLDQAPDGDLIATMRGTGALYRIHPDGIWQTIIPGNGMSTPDVFAFSPAGELLVNNDESALITKIKNGRGEFFASVNSFIPPRAALAFLPSGDFYFSEAAPGFEPRLIRISPGGSFITVTNKLNFPSGLAFNPSGQLFVAESMGGQISMVSPGGAVTPFSTGLQRPQPLAADGSGNLYVGDYEGELQDPDNEAENPTLNRISKVDPSGIMTPYLDHKLAMIAISPAGTLYISGPVGYYTNGVLRVNADRSLTPIAVGFLDPVGLAFDVTGDLYVADNINNSIDRITGFPRAYVAGRITHFISGAAVAHAVISILTGYPLIKRTRVIADGEGHYLIQTEPRRYSVTVSANGHCLATSAVTTAEGRTRMLDLALDTCRTVFLPLLLVP